MEIFNPGDRVVAINTDISVPIYAEDPVILPINLPDGVIQKDRIYHVNSVSFSKTNSQGLYITGLRAFHGKFEITWHSSRFRKVDLARDYFPGKRKKQQPLARFS